MENESNELFLKWRDKFDAFLLNKKGTIRKGRWDKLYDDYCESISNCNRSNLEASFMNEEDNYVPDEPEEDEEPMTFEEDMNSSLDAFDESTMKHQVFSYSTETRWPTRDESHPWPKDSNDLSTVMAIYVVEYLEMDPEDKDAADEFEKIFKTSGK